MGRIERYKGADLLLKAAGHLSPASRIKVMIIGSCSDDAYRSELECLANNIPGRALLKLEWIPQDDLGRYLQASDFAAFPFREITNSSSVILAESFGLPVVVPDLIMLGDVPAETSIRYLPGNGSESDSLTTALHMAERLSSGDYDAMSSAASAWAHSCDWSTVARRTVDVYESVLGISN
jgi:glycosyltransferase involved in cell wall biosynthesis